MLQDIAPNPGKSIPAKGNRESVTKAKNIGMVNAAATNFACCRLMLSVNLLWYLTNRAIDKTANEHAQRLSIQHSNELAGNVFWYPQYFKTGVVLITFGLVKSVSEKNNAGKYRAK